MDSFVFGFFVFFLFFFSITVFADFSCTSVNLALGQTCNLPARAILRLSNASNAHAEIVSQNNYSSTGIEICCSGAGYSLLADQGSCTNESSRFIKLQSTVLTNLHGQFVPTGSNYFLDSQTSSPPFNSVHCLNTDNSSVSMFCSGLPANFNPYDFGFFPSNCLFGLSNSGVNSHFFTCASTPNTAEYLKVFCVDGQAGSLSLGRDVWQLEIQAFNAGVLSNVFNLGDQIDVEITVTNLSTKSGEILEGVLTIGFQSADGSFSEQAGPVTLPALDAGESYAYTGFSRASSTLNPETYVVYASIEPDATETVLLNNSAQEFVTVVSESNSSASAVSEHGIFSVFFVLVVVLALIGFKPAR